MSETLRSQLGDGNQPSPSSSLPPDTILILDDVTPTSTGQSPATVTILDGTRRDCGPHPDSVMTLDDVPLPVTSHDVQLPATGRASDSIVSLESDLSSDPAEPQDDSSPDDTVFIDDLDDLSSDDPSFADDEALPADGPPPADGLSSDLPADGPPPADGLSSEESQSSAGAGSSSRAGSSFSGGGVPSDDGALPEEEVFTEEDLAVGRGPGLGDWWPYGRKFRPQDYAQDADDVISAGPQPTAGLGWEQWQQEQATWEATTGFALLEDANDLAREINRCEGKRLIRIAQLDDVETLNPLPPPPGPAGRKAKPLKGLTREDMTVHGAPRSAVVSDGGERPSLLRRRSGGVKLEEARAMGWW